MNPSDEISTEIAVENLTRSKRFFGWAATISGAAVVVPPLIGFLVTAIGMMRAFGKLKTSGKADPSVLAGDISMALIASTYSLILSAISLIPFIVFLVLFYNRRRELLCITDKNRA